MTIYVHNTPEPSAIPTQPMRDARDLDGYYFANFDIATLGRCGCCSSCPRIWHLNCPVITGGTGGGSAGAENWFGNYYLFKVQYWFYYQNSQDLLFTNNLCQWAQRDNEPISGANRYQPPGAGSDYRGWNLRFENPYGNNTFNWWLYSPHAPSEYPARWKFIGNPFNDFRCLRPNSFRLDNIHNVEPAFPYQPQILTVTPWHP